MGMITTSNRVSHFMLERVAESKCLSTLILPPMVAEGIPFGDTYNRTHSIHTLDTLKTFSPVYICEEHCSLLVHTTHA
jgi:hypothetical protein